MIVGAGPVGRSTSRCPSPRRCARRVLGNGAATVNVVVAAAAPCISLSPAAAVEAVVAGRARAARRCRRGLRACDPDAERHAVGGQDVGERRADDALDGRRQRRRAHGRSRATRPTGSRSSRACRSRRRSRLCCTGFGIVPTTAPSSSPLPSVERAASGRPPWSAHRRRSSRSRPHSSKPGSPAAKRLCVSKSTSRAITSSVVAAWSR